MYLCNAGSHKAATHDDQFLDDRHGGHVSQLAGGQSLKGFRDEAESKHFEKAKEKD